MQLMKAKEEGGGVNAVIATAIDTVMNDASTNAAAAAAAAASAAQKSRTGYNRFDQERYAGKGETGGFTIDTQLTYQPTGGAMSLGTPNHPNATPLHDNQNSSSVNNNKSSEASVSNQLTQQKTNVIANNAIHTAQIVAGGGGLHKRAHTKPIIVIPNTATSLVTMHNVIDLLQELKFVASEDKKKHTQQQNMIVNKDSEIILHRRENGQTIQFKVIDNVTRLSAADW